MDIQNNMNSQSNVSYLRIRPCDNDNEIYFAIASYVTLQRVKNFLVGKMNLIKSIGTFLQKGNGFEVTNPEGYVAVDRMGNAVKLVDRLEFSTANFTLAKNWIKG